MDDVVCLDNNFLDTVSAEELIPLIVTRIPDSKEDNVVYEQNAQTLVTSVVPALIELRDQGKLKFSIATVLDHLLLGKMVKLTQRDDVSKTTISAIESFLTSVGWQKEQPLEKQPRSLAEQFGYARAYCSVALDSLAN